MEITLEHVSKHFKDKNNTTGSVKKAVEDVTLHLSPGVWGLLGFQFTYIFMCGCCCDNSANWM